MVLGLGEGLPALLYTEQAADHGQAGIALHQAGLASGQQGGLEGEESGPLQSRLAGLPP